MGRSIETCKKIQANFVSRSPIQSNGAPWYQAIADGDSAWIAHQFGIYCLDLARRAERWRLDFPDCSRITAKLPRCIETVCPFRPLSRSNSGLVYFLTPEATGGFALHAIRERTGEIVWSMPEPMPAPTDWTETSRVEPSSHSEDMHASLIRAADRVIVLLRRHSRQSECWLADGTHIPRPPFRSQLHLYGFDPHSGRRVYESVHTDAWARPFGAGGFDGLFYRERDVFDVEIMTGVERHLYTLPDIPDSICCLNGVVYLVRRIKSDVVVVAFPRNDPSQAMEQVFCRKGVRQLHLHICGDEVLLQISESCLLPLKSPLSSESELRIRPYLYHVYPLRNARLAACSGRGMALFCFDRLTGRRVFEETGGGSVFGLFGLANTGGAIAVRDKGLIDVFDNNGMRTQQLRDKSESNPLAVSGRTVIGIASLPEGDVPTLVDLPLC